MLTPNVRTQNQRRFLAFGESSTLVQYILMLLKSRIPVRAPIAPQRPSATRPLRCRRTTSSHWRPDGRNNRKGSKHTACMGAAMRKKRRPRTERSQSSVIQGLRRGDIPESRDMALIGDVGKKHCGLATRSLTCDGTDDSTDRVGAECYIFDQLTESVERLAFPRAELATLKDGGT